MKSRRHFLKAASLSLAGTGVLPLVGSASSMPAEIQNKPATMLQMGVAGYTFNQFNIDQSIAMMQRIGVNMLSLKEFHLPLDSTKEKAEEVVGKFKAAGITVYTVGVIYMKTQASVDQTFNYARNVGVDMIVGVPNYELLKYTEQKVKETGIRLAIHNHGPEDKLYPGPKDVYDNIKNMDKGMGICLDIGHGIRAGADPAKSVESFKDRLYDLHIKDVSVAAKEGKAIELGRGVIDFSALVAALRKVNYKGKCSIEFEKDMKDPLPGIAESVGFFRGIMHSSTA